MVSVSKGAVPAVIPVRHSHVRMCRADRLSGRRRGDPAWACGVLHHRAHDLRVNADGAGK